MKNILLRSSAIALVLGFMSSNAHAIISHNLTINASVQAGCTSTAAPTGTAGITTSLNSSTFAATVTGTTQAPAGGTLTFGNITCTTNAARVILTSARNGLFVEGQQSVAGAKKMNYVATAEINSVQVAQLATVQGGTATGQRALITGSNSVAVRISFPGTESELLPAGPLTAGIYSDTITINIDGVI